MPPPHPFVDVAWRRRRDLAARGTAEPEGRRAPPPPSVRVSVRALARPWAPVQVLALAQVSPALGPPRVWLRPALVRRPWPPPRAETCSNSNRSRPERDLRACQHFAFRWSDGIRAGAARTS